jgi:hypothetical protein
LNADSTIPAKVFGFSYTVFGLHFRSSLPIAGLMQSSSAKTPDVKVYFGSVPFRNSSNTRNKLRYTSAYLGEGGEPALRIWEIDGGAFLRMSYFDGTEFWLDREISTLWAHWSDKSSLENTLSYLVGPVLGLLLRLRGVVCLHGSAVAIGDRGIIFVGAEGAGKSTTAAAFARQGFAVLSDDIAALAEHEGIFEVLPAYPRVNLWPAAVQLLYGTPDALPHIMTNWDKRCLTLKQEGAARFEERSLSIGAIYVFGDPSAEAETCVEVISRRTALMMLVANTYATNFLDARQRAEEFMSLGRLVEAVPVRKVNPRRGALPAEGLCDEIRRDFVSI